MTNAIETGSAPRPFVRSMKLLGVLMLTLSAITPASSVFVIVPGIIQQAGSGALISLAAAAVVALAMAFVYAEVGSAWPLAGGEYALVGRTLGPFAGFVLMGAFTVASNLAPAVLALGASTYLAAVWPGAPAIPIGVAIIAMATLFGILNVRLNAWVTGLFLAVEVLALAALAWLGFGYGVRSWPKCSPIRWWSPPAAWSRPRRPLSPWPPLSLYSPTTASGSLLTSARRCTGPRNASPALSSGRWP